MKPTPIDLNGAVVAITGAGRGIGRATAAAFVAAGARVALGDLDSDAAQDAADAVGGHAFAVDVTSRESFASFVDAVTELLGPIDVLVNNAGIMPAGRFLDESDRTAEAMIDVNVHGPIFGMKLVLPGMLERGRGHVVNVASGAGKVEIPGLATYCASKHAVVGLNGTVARELRGTGVTVSAVLPSAVNTELASGIPFPAARFAKVEPEDVARAIVNTVRNRPREVTVPSWLALYDRLTTLMPDMLEEAVRKLIDDDRAITQVDPGERAAYTDRIERQTA